eukprot:763633-Hanusia_phi.AAC.3
MKNHSFTRNCVFLALIRVVQFVKLIVDRAVGHNGLNFNAASNDSFKLNQVGLWGAETGDVFGNGESYDGDGVGTNISAEEHHP